MQKLTMILALGIAVAGFGTEQPVAPTVGGRCDTRDHALERERTVVVTPERTEEAGVAVAEHATIGGSEPVAVPARCGGDTDYRADELETGGAALVVRVTSCEDATVGCGDPVTVARGRGSDRDERRVEIETGVGTIRGCT